MTPTTRGPADPGCRLARDAARLVTSFVKLVSSRWSSRMRAAKFSLWSAIARAGRPVTTVADLRSSSTMAVSPTHSPADPSKDLLVALRAGSAHFQFAAHDDQQLLCVVAGAPDHLAT